MNIFVEDKEKFVKKLLKSKECRNSILYKENKKIEKRLKTFYLWDVKEAMECIIENVKREKASLPYYALNYLYILPLRLKFSNSKIRFLMCEGLKGNRFYNESIDGEYTIFETMLLYNLDYFFALYYQFVETDYILKCDSFLFDMLDRNKSTKSFNPRYLALTNNDKFVAVKGNEEYSSCSFLSREDIYKNHKPKEFTTSQEMHFKERNELFKDEKEKFENIYKKEIFDWSEKEEFSFYLYVKDLWEMYDLTVEYIVSHEEGINQKYAGKIANDLYKAPKNKLMEIMEDSTKCSSTKYFMANELLRHYK